MNLIYAEKLVLSCIKKKIRINLAESCTGGLICSKIVSIPDASKVFELGLVTYSNNSKNISLGVPKKILLNHGAVSKETAFYMVSGLSRHKNINFSFALTGIAGPEGGTPHKPVGLVYFSFCANNSKIRVDKKIFKGNRNQIREKAANYSLRKAVEIINSSM